jgi:hypothetical protein
MSLIDVSFTVSRLPLVGLGDARYRRPRARGSDDFDAARQSQRLDARRAAPAIDGRRANAEMPNG